MRVWRLAPRVPSLPPNEAARLYELNADDVFARRRRLRVDSSLGQDSRRRLGHPNLRRPR